MMYAKNKILERTVEFYDVDWMKQSNHEPTIKLHGEFTFDFYHNVDRDLWLDYFKSLKQKTAPGQEDRFFATKELVVQDYIKKSGGHNIDIGFNIVPTKMQESPKSFLYNELIGYKKIHEKYILPMLRKKGYFSPLTPYLDGLFFKFDMDAFDIETIEIPHDYQLRTIFKIKFSMTFDAAKFVEYIIVKKKASFSLNIWPVFEFKIRYPLRFPLMLTRRDNIKLMNWLDDHISMIITKNPTILRYCYQKTKVRLDRVKRMKYKMSSHSMDVVITTDDVNGFIIQLIKGKIDIFGKHSHGFDVQKLKPEFAKTHMHDIGSHNMAFTLFYFYAFYSVFASIISDKKRTISQEEYIKEVTKAIKQGKIKDIVIRGIK